MTKNKIMIVASYAERPVLTLEEFCEVCHLTSDVLYDFVAYDIIQPQGAYEEEWLFDLEQLKRVQRALRLQHDLEMNLASVAVVLELLDEVDKLRRQVALYEKHYFK